MGKKEEARSSEQDERGKPPELKQQPYFDV